MTNLGKLNNSEISFKVTQTVNEDPEKNTNEGQQEKSRYSLVSQNLQHTFATKIPFNLFPNILDVILSNVNSTNEQIVTYTHNCNTALIKMIEFYPSELENMNVKNFEDILKNYFSSKKELTLEIILNWVVKLFGKFYDDMFNRVDVFIDSFTFILNDCNENVNKFSNFRFSTRSWTSSVRSRSTKKTISI